MHCLCFVVNVHIYLVLETWTDLSHSVITMLWEGRGVDHSHPAHPKWNIFGNPPDLD